ncbi:hypothetical protein [Ochrovirga pacifica]|uniref:hypothetical protein n=1 Tax=Ochrovirga pacifica TaxID=1042376 RepID=UPI0002557FDE|nr:hypothetical protein [Ochrovirga pacifica]
MKPKTKLYYCKTKLDAYFLKNIIQKIRTIPVEIVYESTGYVLLVKPEHYRIANVIVGNEKYVLPSNYLKRLKKEKEENLAITSNPNTHIFSDVVLNLKNKMCALHHVLQSHSLNTIHHNLHMVN